MRGQFAQKVQDPDPVGWRHEVVILEEIAGGLRSSDLVLYPSAVGSPDATESDLFFAYCLCLSHVYASFSLVLVVRLNHGFGGGREKTGRIVH